MGEVTVVSFLEYLYAPAKDKETVLLIQSLVGPDQYIYKRTFGKEKFTLDLLRIGHMYQVDDLLKDCTEYLKGNISENQKALELLEAACTLDIPDLEEGSVKYLEDKITDDNVMSFWKVAAKCHNKIVYTKAIQHLLFQRPE